MSLYINERVKEQEADDRKSEKNIVFTFPWILNTSFQGQDEHIEDTVFSTNYKMASFRWNVLLIYGLDDNYVSIKNRDIDGMNGDCFISYNLYYDFEMRFEYFSSTRIQMNKALYGGEFETPDGYMSKFIEAAKNNKFSKCAIFIELHLPTKYFYQPCFKMELREIENEIFDEFSDDFENDFGLEFMKNGDYIFECLDGIVRAQRIALFLSSATMKKQLRPPRHYPVGTVLYTVAVIEPIIIFFHSHVFKLSDSFDLDYIQELLRAIVFFEPFPNPKRTYEMMTKVDKALCQKFAKDTHDFNSLLLWLSFSCNFNFFESLTIMICNLIANEYYFKWQETFPETARNMENPLYRQLFEHAETVRNENNQFRLNERPSLAERIFESIHYKFVSSRFTNIILQ
uniref:Uncharacterized protein n=1 Tax=Panagrolaimus sp. ES5 TaxID=591445 RepID=A0AC34FPE5_9BILA